MDCSTPDFPVFHHLPHMFILMSFESVMPSNHLILCHPLLLLPSVFPSIRFFSNESALCIRGPKYWHLSFSISPSNEYSGLMHGLLLSPWSPRDSQESSPAPQLKSIISLVLSLLYGPILISKEQVSLISRLRSLPTVILEPKKIKSVTISTFPPSICHEVHGMWFHDYIIN